MKREGILSLTGVVLLLLGGLLTLPDWEKVVIADPSPDQQELPMLQLEGVSARHFNSDGQAEMTLQASAMSWLEKEGVSRVTQPRVVIPGGDGQWEVNATQGELSQQDGIVVLTGDVIAIKQGPDAMTLTTNQLIYDSHAGTARAPGAIRLEHSSGITSAGQLSVNMADGSVILEHGVETRYAAPTGQ